MINHQKAGNELKFIFILVAKSKNLLTGIQKGTRDTYKENLK